MSYLFVLMFLLRLSSWVVVAALIVVIVVVVIVLNVVVVIDVSSFFPLFCFFLGCHYHLCFVVVFVYWRRILVHINSLKCAEDRG